MTVACAQLPLVPPLSSLSLPLHQPLPKTARRSPAGSSGTLPSRFRRPASSHDRLAGRSVGAVNGTQHIRGRHRPPDERDPHGAWPAPTTRLAPAFGSRRLSHQPDGPAGLLRARVGERSRFLERIERFYPSRRARSWSVGENILWGSPEVSASTAVREWMMSRPHRANILSREWRDVGLGAAHFDSAPGEYRGGPVTIVTADFGART